ncbi:putative protein FAM107B-like [Scophthalmus maximus]|uniref:Uncharacterized protein n=1 Tax=Scophthalmus maximus TaxID=52904 RepID=A0A2U9BZ60_SCOMX|nr:putative protein FAM107B-like [Scophthalmus maximus]
MAAIKSVTDRLSASSASLQGPEEGQDLKAYVENYAGHAALSRQSTADGIGDETVQPRKLNGSSVDPPSYQNLHRELLLSHKRYRRSNTSHTSDLLRQYEQEEIRQRENQQKIPEFVRVKDNLRRTQTFEQ